MRIADSTPATLALACLPLFQETPAPALEPAAAEPAGAAGIELRWLANMGFLLAAGEAKVLIDAFVGETYLEYGALEGEALEDLLHARGLFEGVDVALASHHHRDHFQGAVARRFLAADPGCLLVSSFLVVDALVEAGGPASADVPLDSVRALYPEPGAEETVEVGNVRVELLNLPHGTRPGDHEENIGHLVTLGGARVLHLGDAAMSEPVFAAYALPARRIDVALVPYWFFGDEEGLRIVEKHLRPARLVACHVPVEELEDVTSWLAEEHPDVLVPGHALMPLSFSSPIRRAATAEPTTR